MQLKYNINVAVDAVVFGYRNNQLQILLINQKFGSERNKWALPGGFIKPTESLESAVVRELNEETGIRVNYLEQLYTFGEVDRDPRGRVISISYLALINPQEVALKAATDAQATQWYDIKKLPELAFDHEQIIKIGLERLRAKINYRPIGFELLNEKFPFSDLENLYQTILAKNIDRRNFRKKINSFALLIELNEYHKLSGSGRPGKLFKFDKLKYKELSEQGFIFDIKFA